MLARAKVARDSAYVFRLQQKGIRIDMEREPHAPVSGSHGRYYCRSKVVLRERCEVAA